MINTNIQFIDTRTIILRYMFSFRKYLHLQKFDANVNFYVVFAKNSLLNNQKLEYRLFNFHKMTSFD